MSCEFQLSRPGFRAVLANVNFAISILVVAFISYTTKRFVFEEEILEKKIFKLKNRQPEFLTIAFSSSMASESKGPTIARTEMVLIPFMSNRPCTIRKKDLMTVFQGGLKKVAIAPLRALERHL